MKSIKAIKPIKQTHTSRTKTGSGDFYGQAVKQKVGRPIDLKLEHKLTKKQIKSPPKSLA